MTARIVHPWNTDRSYVCGACRKYLGARGARATPVWHRPHPADWLPADSVISAGVAAAPIEGRTY